VFSSQIATFRFRDAFSTRVTLASRNRTKKGTEPGAPSSDLPTDLRRSGYLSEGHQPQALRPRCTPDTRASWRPRQATPIRKIRTLRTFCIMRTCLRRALCALVDRDQGFAEPGALSSTSPADLPLPRTASRESFVLLASRARRSGNVRRPADPFKGNRPRKARKLRRSSRPTSCRGRVYAGAPAAAASSQGSGRGVLP
jgi:hypothetical protein